MKKIYIKLSIVVSLLIAILLVACACSKGSALKTNEIKTEESIVNNTDKKIKIVTSIYPIYDFVNNIIKGKEDKFDVSILMTSGVDLHNFQPTAKDILDIGVSDLFIYVGGESDDWTDGVIRQAINKNMKTINLMELLRDKVKVEELKEGMEEEEHHHEDEEEHEENEEHGENDEHEDEIEYDEHVWLSLNNAMLVCKKLEEEIVRLDSEYSDVYKLNTDSYITALKDLDAKYKETVSNATRKVLLFADRFPFRYMVDDYGLDYFAAFKGCAAETEASFEIIKFLSDKLGELQLPYVLKIDGSDGKIAQAVIDNSSKNDTTIETMYSIQAVSSDDIRRGETYLTFMNKNLEVLKKVLN